MKQVLKVIFLTFLSVIGAFGLVIGGMYLFGGFEEKIVYAENISFSSEEYISSRPFALKITTTTEDVTETELKLSVLAGGESVIDFPSRAKIGQIITITPKQVNGVNFGGNVTLKAEYDGNFSNKNAVAYCNILIDVPVKTVDVNIPSLNTTHTTTPGQTIYICQKDQELSKVFGIDPANSLMPYVSYGTKKINSIVDKKLYIEISNDRNMLLDSSIAQFEVDGVLVDQKLIQVPYSYRTVDGENHPEIVFDKNINLVTKSNPAGNIKLNTYVYSTYQEQNSRENLQVLSQDDKNVTASSFFGFSIGEYVVSDMSINNQSRDLYLYENSKIYLNYDSGVDGDINLEAELFTNSANIEVDKYHLLNTYISVDNNDYCTIKNANGKISAVDSWTPVAYERIPSTESSWYWILTLDSYEAFKNGVEFEIRIKYYEEKKDSNNQIVEIIELPAQTFIVHPKIYDITGVSVDDDPNAFKVKSDKINNNMVLNDGKFSIASNLTNTQLDRYSLEYYLAYDENKQNGKTTISVVPNEKGKLYKVLFDFEIEEQGYIRYYDNSSSLSVTNCVLSQNGDVKLTDNGNPPHDAAEFNGKQKISVEALVTIGDYSYENVQNLFVFHYRKELSDEPTPIYITNFMTKFYERIGTSTEVGNIYSNKPYLSVDGVRYNTDFEFYTFYDENDEEYKYLKLLDMSASVSGIGSFNVTAQVVIKEREKTYWIEGKRASANFKVHQQLSNMTIYAYTPSDDYKDSDPAVYETTDADGKKVFDKDVESNENDSTKKYLFITSTELEALENYINSSLFSIGATQYFGEDVEISATQKNKALQINNNVFVFDPVWKKVYKNDNLIGFMSYYTIGEVRSFSLTGSSDLKNDFIIEAQVVVGAPEPVRAKFAVDKEDTLLDYYQLSVKDKVVTTATLEYNGRSFGESNALKIYASGFDSSTKEIVYSEVDGSSSKIDFSAVANKLIYKFNYSKDESMQEKMSVDFSIVGSAGLEKQGLYSFNLAEGLKLNNFPYVDFVTDGPYGTLFKMSIGPSSKTEKNSHYVWNSSKADFDEEYYDLNASIYFRVQGLKIEIEANDVDAYGKNDTDIDIFGNTGLFKIKVSTAKNATSVNEILASDYAKAYKTFKISMSNQDYFAINDDNSSMKSLKDLINNRQVIFSFYLGSTSGIGNFISIKTGEASFDSSYPTTILSPYIFDYNRVYTAPDSESLFVKTFKYQGNETADVYEKVSLSLNIVANTMSVDFQSLYGILSPISVNSDNTLKLKSVPVNYTVNITYVISAKDNSDSPREKTVTLTINSGYEDSNVAIGTYDDVNNYYYITAGENNLRSVTNGGIVLGGVLLNNVADIYNVEVVFSDKEQNEQVSASSHMNHSFSSTTKSFSLFSSDINYQKTVIAKITFTFKRGGTYSGEDLGKMIFEKVLVIKPNIFITLNKTSYHEGDIISLTSADTYNFVNTADDYDELDILTTFDYNSSDANKYSLKNFDFEGKNPSDVQVFSNVSDLIDYAGVTISVKTGASALCDGASTITFYYIVNSHYTLTFNFDITITE